MRGPDRTASSRRTGSARRVDRSSARKSSSRRESGATRLKIQPRGTTLVAPSCLVAFSCRLFDWYDVKETRQFERLAQKVNSALTLVESNETGEAAIIPRMGDGVTPPKPKTGGEPQEQILFGGLVRYIKNGGNLKAHESSRPGDGWQKFDRTIVSGAFYGMGWRIEMRDNSGATT